MAVTKEQGEALRAFYESDPKIAVLAEMIGLTKAQLLDGIEKMDEPVFFLKPDYSFEADVAGVERAVKIATEKFAYHAGRAKDAVEAAKDAVANKLIAKKRDLVPTGPAKAKKGAVKPASLAAKQRC